MATDLAPLVDHDLSDDCPVCRAAELVAFTLMPAAAAWEQTHELPQFSVALHGAAQLLGVMIQEGIPRDEIEGALSTLLDEIEAQIEEDKTFGGPPQGSA